MFGVDSNLSRLRQNRALTKTNISPLCELNVLNDKVAAQTASPKRDVAVEVRLPFGEPPRFEVLDIPHPRKRP